MPDITVLPMLAEYFHVLVDQILGLVPLAGEEYIPHESGKKEYWWNRLDNLLRTRKTYWNEDYVKFLVRQVWRFNKPVEILDCGCKVVADYVIWQKTLDVEKKFCIAGFYGMVIAALTYYFCGGIQIIEVQPETKNIVRSVMIKRINSLLPENVWRCTRSRKGHIVKRGT